jgi:hypothetical protein
VPGRIRSTLAYLLGLVPAGAFLLGGLIKGADPELFAEQITAHGLTPAAWSPWLAHLFIAAELLLALALLLQVRPVLALSLSALLLLFFMAVTAAAWALGNTEACGCFGRLADRGPGEVILEDLLFLLATVAAWRLLRGRPQRLSAWRRAAFGALAIGALFYTAAGRDLPLDAWATGLRPGADLSDLAVDGIRQPLDEGRVLLLIFDETTAPDRAMLQALRASADDLQVVLVLQGTAREAAAWRLKHLPPFPLGHASARVLRQYYRRLPVGFLLQDGRLVRAFWRRWPDPSELPAGPSTP